jgi:hypothetical protein
MTGDSGHPSEAPRPTERAGESVGSEPSSATQRTDHTPNDPGEPTIDAPVLDGAEELRQEAEAAVESGEVDLSDTRHGGPSVVEKPVVTE